MSENGADDISLNIKVCRSLPPQPINVLAQPILVGHALSRQGFCLEANNISLPRQPIFVGHAVPPQVWCWMKHPSGSIFVFLLAPDGVIYDGKHAMYPWLVECCHILPISQISRKPVMGHNV